MFARYLISRTIFYKNGATPLRFCSKRTISEDQKKTLEKSLCEILGSKNFQTSEAIREQYGKDEGHHRSCLADFVVWPSSTKEVSQISKICHDLNIPIIPFGSGTGLEGGVNALQGGVCIALNKMNKVIEVNAEDFDCTVEAGLTWRELNQNLSGTGLFFPIDPGASASLGGMSSTNASGTNAVLYGTMKENVLNLEIVLSDGKIMKTAGRNSRARKSSAGFNLTQLFVGSEGILGTITKITLRLHPIPEQTCVCLCHFQDNKSAVDTVIQLLQNKIPVSRIEYVDGVSIKASNQYSKMNLVEKPSLFIEISGSQSQIDAVIDVTKEIIKENDGQNFKTSSVQEERSQLWKARHELFYACRSSDPRPNHETLITDVVVPISKLTDIVLKMHQYLTQYNLLGFAFGHVGDGNFHTVICYDSENKIENENVELVATKIAKDAIQLGGSCTGEHGIGRGKMDLLMEEFDPVSYQVMCQIKKALDPKNLMNPGKVLKI